jgi:MFS family permease
VDLRLFKNKVFTAAISTSTMMSVGVMGGIFLMPMYLQVVRGQSALASGLLLVPQSLGAMAGMPIAGKLSDKVAVGRIAPFGLATSVGCFVWLTTLTAETPFWHLDIALFCMGLGMAFSMTPIMTASVQTIERPMIPNASTTMNIAQQIGSSIGTAMVSVLLAGAIAGRVSAAIPAGATPNGKADLNTVSVMPPEVLAQVRPLLADAFAGTYRWAVGFGAAALLVGLLVLPKRRIILAPEPVPTIPAA